MESLGSWVQTLIAVAAIATVAGFGLQRGTVVNLRERLQDAKSELADANTKITELEALRVKDKAEFVEVKADLAALRRTVTGAAQWDAIATKLDQHHQEAIRHWEKDETVLEEIRDTLKGRQP